MVVVISPNQIKNLHGRSGSAGNKDDRSGAYVLADTLRTDRARLAPLTPDSPAGVFREPGDPFGGRGLRSTHYPPVPAMDLTDRLRAFRFCLRRRRR